MAGAAFQKLAQMNCEFLSFLLAFILSCLAGKPEGMTPLVRSRRRCEDKIRIDLRASGLEVVDWVTLTSCVNISFQRRSLLHEVS